MFNSSLLNFIGVVLLALQPQTLRRSKILKKNIFIACVNRLLSGHGIALGQGTGRQF